MEKCLRLFDTLQLRPVTVNPRKEAYFHTKDGLSHSGNSLLVRIAASHAGRLTGNHALYTPAMMKVAITSFTNPYQKPVLLNHDEDSSPIGRIKSAEYIDTSEELVQRDKHLRDFFRPGANFSDMLKLVDKVSNRLMDPLYAGMGFAQVVARITDPDAITKILDGRYLTVSTSMVTDAAVCSICKTDWLKDGKCDHTPGKMYDKKPCFIITGNMRYDELSYVNRPADALAQNMEILSDGQVQDSITVEQFPVYDIAQDIFIAGRNLLVNAGDIKNTNLYSLQDSLQEVINLMKINKSEPKPDVALQKIIDSLLLGIEDAAMDISTHADQEMMIKVHNHLHDYHDWDVDSNGVAPKMAKDKLQLHAKLHKCATEGGFVDSFNLGNLDNTLEALGVESPESPGKKEGIKTDDKVSDEAGKIQDNQDAAGETPVGETDPAAATGEVNIEDSLPLIDEILDEAKCYEAIATILDELTAETGDQSFADAKLSPEKRKNLKGSTFCGPNKSFPVNDCAHYTAALRLVGRYKGPGSKDAIVSCIERKGKALGCGSEKKEDSTCTTCLPSREELETQRQDALQVLQQLDDELKERFDIVFACPDCQKAGEKITALESAATVDLVQLDALQMDVTALEDENVLLRTQLKDTLIDNLIDTRQLANGQMLPVEDQEKMKSEFASRGLESLTDSLRDMRAQLVTKNDTGMAQTPIEGQVSDPIVKDEEAKVDPDAGAVSLRKAVMSQFNLIVAHQGKPAAQAYLSDMEKRYPEIKVDGPKKTKRS